MNCLEPVASAASAESASAAESTTAAMESASAGGRAVADLAGQLFPGNHCPDACRGCHDFRQGNLDFLLHAGGDKQVGQQQCRQQGQQDIADHAHRAGNLFALQHPVHLVERRFGAGRVFLPQVLLSAEAMREAFTKLKELLPAAETKTLGTVVLATVKGDVHDLGKNIVAALLQNSGFKLIDLGKDVPAQTIVEAAKANRADIVGLCALMTTTMKQMKEVVDYAKSQGCRAKIIIGGAVITGDYSDEIGADGFSKDAAAAVTLADKLMVNC